MKLNSITGRLAIILIGSIAGMILLSITALYAIHSNLIGVKKAQIVAVVDAAADIVEKAHQLEINSGLSQAEAKRNALQALKNLHYLNATSYVWVHNLETPIPRMIMHPAMPSLDGHVLDASEFETASFSLNPDSGQEESFEKRNLFVAMNGVVNTAGHGFVKYLWEKPKGAEDRKGPIPKLSYVRLYKPWGWVLGAGVYVDDIEASFWSSAQWLSEVLLYSKSKT